MAREIAGIRQTAYGIGLSAGLVVGLIGVAQWILSAHDLEVRLAAVGQAGGGDGNTVYWNYIYFWVGTAFLAVLVAVTPCVVAAYVAGRVVQRRRDGVVAALMAAVIGVVVYAVATPVALGISPEPSIAGSLVGCEPVCGAVFFALVSGLAPVIAIMGVDAGKSVSIRP